MTTYNVSLWCRKSTLLDAPLSSSRHSLERRIRGALRSPAVLSIIPAIKIRPSIRNSPPELSRLFQILSMPFFPCIITECSKIMPGKQGLREMSSTGSHAQIASMPQDQVAYDYQTCSNGNSFTNVFGVSLLACVKASRSPEIAISAGLGTTHYSTCTTPAHPCPASSDG